MEIAGQLLIYLLPTIRGQVSRREPQRMELGLLLPIAVGLATLVAREPAVELSR